MFVFWGAARALLLSPVPAALEAIFIPFHGQEKRGAESGLR
jgi:hypothetical protein